MTARVGKRMGEVDGDVGLARAVVPGDNEEARRGREGNVDAGNGVRLLCGLFYYYTTFFAA